MKTTPAAQDFTHLYFAEMRSRVFAALLLVFGSVAAHGQGTVVFDGQVGIYGTNYYESGMWFRVVVPPSGEPYHDGMVIVPGNRYENVPQDTTPFMGFFQQYNPHNYVMLSLATGSSFGLTSVSLADPNSPSLSPLPITFVGFRGDGSLVSQTFTTPGNGANSFLTYQFNPDFASGLTRVDITSSRWAMDNLVVVPEPSTVWLGLLGSGILVYARRRQIKKRSLR